MYYDDYLDGVIKQAFCHGGGGARMKMTDGLNESVIKAVSEADSKKQKTIAVIFGGCSPEYNVSLQSAAAVISNMDLRRYTPVMIGISRHGAWYHYDGSVERIAADEWLGKADSVPVQIDVNRGERALIRMTGGGNERINIDAAFPVLHGKNGEDGTVQGMLELAGIPVVGCGVLASALCMDKYRAHKLAAAFGIDVPKAYVIERNTDEGEALSFSDRIGYPLFVKPVKAGSSFGVTKVADRKSLPAAIEAAFEYDDEVIIEEAIDGFEVGCAVIGNKELSVGEVDEIELSGGFFDNTEKYTLKTSAIHVPARIDDDIVLRIKETAKKIYKILGCRGFARVDMFLASSGRIVFNEVNTIPGFTAHSRFPNMLKAAGMSFGQIITAVIETAL